MAVALPGVAEVALRFRQRLFDAFLSVRVAFLLRFFLDPDDFEVPAP